MDLIHYNRGLTASCFTYCCQREFTDCVTTEEIGRLFAHLRSKVNLPTNPVEKLFKLNTVLLDVVVKRVCELAVEHLEYHYRASDFAVVAIGGYGRQEIYPLSDIDIALLATGDDVNFRLLFEICERLLREVQRFTPEVGIDFNYCHLSMLEELDHRSLTALIEMRQIYGNTLVFQLYKRAFWQYIQTRLDGYIQAKYDERQSVISTWGGTNVQGNLPNVKNGYGGIREFQSTNWMGRIRYRVQTRDVWRCIVDEGLATWPDLIAAFRHQQVLQQIRVHLHIAAGYYENSIKVENSDVLAWQLGYRDVNGKIYTDTFILDCFQSMNAIGSLFERIRTQILK